MNNSEFIALLRQPAEITSSQTRALEAILEQYPYFQSARAMQLKGLKNNKSYTYNKQLKVAAAHTVDRSVLFDFITSAEFAQNDIANRLQSRDAYLKTITVFEPQEVISQKSIAIDDAIKMKLKEAQQVLDANLFEEHQPKKKIIKADTKLVAVAEETSEDRLGIGKPLEFDKTESHSFSEWLKLTAVKPINREESSSKENDSEEYNLLAASKDSEMEISEEVEDKARKFQLIDNFIATNPKIVPEKTPSKINLSDLNNVPQESLMTATLAKVYLEQKNYKKAIQAYKILILKNPEKSSFFANQIQEIQTLIEKHSE